MCSVNELETFSCLASMYNAINPSTNIMLPSMGLNSRIPVVRSMLLIMMTVKIVE